MVYRPDHGNESSQAFERICRDGLPSWLVPVAAVSGALYLLGVVSGLILLIATGRLSPAGVDDGWDRWGDAFDASVNPDLDDIAATYVEAGAEVVVLEADGRIRATGTLAPTD